MWRQIKKALSSLGSSTRANETGEFDYRFVRGELIFIPVFQHLRRIDGYLPIDLEEFSYGYLILFLK